MSLGLLRRQQNNGLGMVILIVLVATFAYGVFTGNINWLQMIMIVFTFYALVTLLVPLVVKEETPNRNDFYRPFVSILVPAKNEEKVIGNTLSSLAKLQYFRNGRPNFEIIVVDDASADATGQIIKQHQRKLDFLAAVTRAPGSPTGKAAVLNEGLKHAKGEVIAVFDADTQVNSEFILKSVPLLAQDNIAGVQGRVKLYNPDENLVTRLQNDEFLVFNHLAQKGKDILNAVPCLGGNGQLVKRSALEEVGGWNEESLTEDFDLTYRLLLHGYRVKYAEHAVLWQEAVHTWKRLFRQRIRWGEGLISSLCDFLLPVLSANLTAVQRLDGILTLTRILLPFWIIQGYVYQIIAIFKHHPFICTISPTLLLTLTIAFFTGMSWGLKRISPCRWLQMSVRVLQYWLYSVVWILVLPVSYFNYFKTSRAVFWDKTHHKGIEPVPQQAPSTLVFP